MYIAEMFFIIKPRNITIFKQAVRTICCTKIESKQCFAGVLCDIDGVLLRGRKLIPGARESIKTLYDKNIPVVFLTNQGLQLEQEKAESLSEIFDIQVIKLSNACIIDMTGKIYHPRSCR